MLLFLYKLSIQINNGFYYIFETHRIVIFWNVSKSRGTSQIRLENTIPKKAMPHLHYNR